MSAADWLVVAIVVVSVAIVIALDQFERHARWRRETERPISETERVRFLQRHDSELAEQPWRES